jgi:hypothetical protein
MSGWLRIVTESFDRLHADGKESARLLVLAVHPYLIGQPFRIRYLDAALRHILGHDGVWAATAGEIAGWFAANAAAF